MLGCVGFSAGCDGCSKEPKVPFKLGDEVDSGEPLEEAKPAPEALSFSPAIDEPVADEAKVPVPFVRALLLHDLDGDGDRDAFVIAHDANERIRMLASMREGPAFLPATDVSGFAAPGDSTCTLHDAQLLVLSGDKGVAAIKLSCGDAQLEHPVSHTVFSLDALPRVHQRFELDARDEDGSSQLVLQLSGKDADGDGHDDVLLLVREGGEDGQRLELAWLDRASGLSRDVREPEATFAAWANAAQSQLAKSPNDALQTVERILRFERALCRNQGQAQLRVSGVLGVDCGESKASTQALATATMAHANLKHLPEAFASYGQLSRRAHKLDDKHHSKVVAALSNLPRTEGVLMREGPRVDASERPRVRLPAARFVNDSTLFVRRSAPVLYDIETREESAVMVATDDLVRDPAGSLCVADIERDACGLRLRIERAPSAAVPYVRGSEVAKPLLASLSGDAACDTGVGPIRPDAGGFQVLGWAPQGVVTARGADVTVVPLTLAGAAAGEPFMLADGAPLPAPLPSGKSSPDGARFVELTPVGVLLRERGGAAPSLWRPDGYAAIAARAKDVAVSPTGRRVAVVTDEVTYILTRDAPR